MTTLREAAQQALEILERLHGGCTDSDDGTVEAITIWVPEIIDALRAALAEPVQEPATLPGPGLVMCPACCSQFDPALNRVEPVPDPDSPERRCGGPGCDMRCCQPVQEPVAGVVLNEEGRAALVEHGREEWHCVVRNARRLYTAPPQRKPLSEDEIFKIENDIPDDVIGDRAWTIWFTRAVERAHGIGGEHG